MSRKKLWIGLALFLAIIGITVGVTRSGVASAATTATTNTIASLSQDVINIDANIRNINSNVTLVSSRENATAAKVAALGTTSTEKLSDASAVPTGGSFNSKSAEVGSLTLPAGTYQLDINAQAEPDASTTGTVSAQFFVYDQVKNSSFSGDLFNVSADLQPYVSAASSQHDAYASGSSVVTVPSGGETLHVYGFGYDADTGASEYSLITGSLTATKIS
jgi:hypothetical protein